MSDPRSSKFPKPTTVASGDPVLTRAKFSIKQLVKAVEMLETQTLAALDVLDSGDEYLANAVAPLEGPLIDMKEHLAAVGKVAGEFLQFRQGLTRSSLWLADHKDPKVER